MPKRKVPDFFEAYGVPGVSDAAVRKVVAKLNHSATVARSHTQDRRFGNLNLALQTDDKTGIHILDVQAYFDILCGKCPHVKQFLKQQLIAGRQDVFLSGCIYFDECVPGNLIAPDNQRRSWMVYFTWMSLIPFRNDLLWLPLSIIRTEVVQQLPGGLPQCMTVILKALLPVLNNGIVLDSELIITDKLYLLADEDGLKKACSHKGASGLRPCIRCGNCISKGNEVDGYHSIEHSEIDDFEIAEDANMLDTMRYLEQLERTASKSRLEEAEKLSGWKLNPFVFALEPEVWQFLKPNQIIYDAMHCLWGNGICCQELGLFWRDALSHGGVQRSDLETFLGNNWKKTMQIGALGDLQLKRLVGPKLLKVDGSDYNGDCTETLQLLILMTYFANELLSDVSELQLQIASLVALNRVATCILNAKLHPDQIDGLAALQAEHLRLFKASYGSNLIRPKHHYQLHIESQTKACNMVADCFPTERKHKVFKSTFAPNLKRLSGFERSVALRWIEHDMEQLGYRDFQTGIHEVLKKQPIAGVTFGKSLKTQTGHVFRMENILLLKEDDTFQAYMITMCFSFDNTEALIVQPLTLVNAEPSFLWSKWTLQDEYAIMPLEEALSSVRTTFCSRDARNITLLR